MYKKTLFKYIILDISKVKVIEKKKKRTLNAVILDDSDRPNIIVHKIWIACRF